jgi:hypothetical protein
MNEVHMKKWHPKEGSLECGYSTGNTRLIDFQIKIPD